MNVTTPFLFSPVDVKQVSLSSTTNATSYLQLPANRKWFFVIRLKTTATSGTPTSWNFTISACDDSSGSNSVLLYKTAELSSLGTLCALGWCDVNKAYIKIAVSITGGSSPTVTYEAIVDCVRLD